MGFREEVRSDERQTKGERERCVGGSEMAVCRNQWRERERENKLLFLFLFFFSLFFSSLLSVLISFASLHFVGAENSFN